MATFLAVVVSGQYHVCLAFDVCNGIPLAATRLEDHLTATLLIVAAISLLTGARDDVPDHDGKHRMHLEFSWIALTLQITAVALAIFVTGPALRAAVAVLAFSLISPVPRRIHALLGIRGAGRGPLLPRPLCAVFPEPEAAEAARAARGCGDAARERDALGRRLCD